MPDRAYSRLAALFAACLMLVMAFLTGSRGWADLDRLTSEKITEQARDLQDADWLRAWEKSLSLQLRAHQIAPANADYLRQLGLLYSARSRHAATASEREHYETLALEYFAVALQRRPAWAANWVTYAQARYRSAGLDEQTLIAMQRATELGPWEPSVLGGISRLAMRNWSDLPLELQLSAWQIIRNAVAHRDLSGQIQKWAANAGWSGYLKRAQRENAREKQDPGTYQ